MFTLFVIADAPGLATTEADLADIRAALAGVSGLVEARIMVPDATPADHPFAKDGPGPALALQIDFVGRADAADALSEASPLARIACLANAPAGAVAHQLMQARRFPTGAAPAPEPCCTFLVTYPGTADDPRHWLDYYDANHPPIMVRFPGVREVVTFRPVDWTSALPFARSAALQRNKVVFASLADLLAALASPVMAEMRADGKTFPPFTGKTTHFPMTTWRVGGA
jgi:hypothetical protein